MICSKKKLKKGKKKFNKGRNWSTSNERPRFMTLNPPREDEVLPTKERRKNLIRRKFNTSNVKV